MSTKPAPTIENPYAHSAASYLRQGFSPVPTGNRAQRRAKSPVPKGYTGRAATPVTPEQAEEWIEDGYDENNVAIHVTAGWVAIDVDDYEKTDAKGKTVVKSGADTLAEMEAQIGDLPPTVRSTARGVDNPSGIRFYRVPADREFITKLDGIEIIQAKHRYAVVWPSMHPRAGEEEGVGRYEWYGPTGRRLGRVPNFDKVPELPALWVERLSVSVGVREGATSEQLELTRDEVIGWLDTHGTGNACRAVRGVLRSELAKLAAAQDGEGNRYDAAVEGAWAIVRLITEGHLGARDALYKFGRAYRDAVRDEPGRDPSEWGRMVNGAVSKAMLELPPADGDDEFSDDGYSPHGEGNCPDRANWSPLGEFTDAALTDRLAQELFADRACWTKALGWLAWSGQRWSRSSDEKVSELLRAHLLKWLADEAASGAPPERVQAISKLLSKPRIANLASLARGRNEREASAFDRESDAINTPTGIVDLRTAEVTPHDPTRLFTRITRAAYRPGATHQAWIKALEAVPTEVQPYFLARMAQALTGHTPPDDVLLVLTGNGANGKSTVLVGIAKALGDQRSGYASQVPRSLLMAKVGEHPADLMTLRGARFAYIEELPDGRKLEVTRVKETIGTAEITARGMRQDFTTFEATHALVVTTNYVPIVNETDHGTWRRLQLIRFPFTFRKAGDHLRGSDDRLGDPSLRAKVEGDPAVHEAVLAMLIEQAREWYRGGREMPRVPNRVQDDTDSWRADDDLVLRYFRERLEPHDDSHIPTVDLFADFNQWLHEHEQARWSEKTVAARFEGHDALSTTMKRGKVKASMTLYGSASRSATAGNELTSSYNAWLSVRFTDNPGDAP